MSDLLDRLLAKEHRIAPNELRGLDSRELRDLEEAASGRRETPYQARAMEVVTAAEGPQAIPLLTEVLRDHGQDTAVRTAAAAQLGYTSVSATRPLVDALEGEDDRTVLGSAISALARIGSLEALEPLDRFAERSGEPLAAQTRFAATVVAFRHRQPGHEPRLEEYGELREPSAERGIPLIVHGLATDEVEPALTQLRTESYGVGLDSRLTVGVDCAGDRLLAAIDAGIDSHAGDLRGHLAAGPLVVGLVGWRSPVDATFSTRWLVLTWPVEGTQQLAVHRPYGPPFLFGRAEVGDAEATFELTSVSARGNSPTRVQGVVGASRIEIEGISSAERVERGTPRALS